MSGESALSLFDNALILVANIGLNLLLIPRWGIVGAAVAWSASIIVVNAIKVIQAWKIVGIRAEGASTGKIVLAALPAAGAGVLVNHLIENWVASLVVGVTTCAWSTSSSSWFCVRTRKTCVRSAACVTACPEPPHAPQGSGSHPDRRFISTASGPGQRALSTPVRAASCGR